MPYGSEELGMVIEGKVCMRYLIFISLLVLLSGCVTQIPLSHEETCAVKGMVLAGASISKSNSYNTGTVYNSSYQQYGSFNMYGVTRNSQTHCRVPETQKDHCIVDSYRSGVRPKTEFNNKIKSRNALAGLGYMFWLVPGIYVTSQNRKLRREANGKSLKKFTNTLNHCANNPVSKEIREQNYISELDDEIENDLDD